jgi:hypothetical protein
MRPSFFLLAALVLITCSEEPFMPWQNFQPFTARYDTYHLPKSNEFSDKGEVLQTIPLNEVSGLAVSASNKSSLWAHNDSGNSNSLYLLDETTAALKTEFHLTEVLNEDWEDIAVAPGPKKGTAYIYLGDIGDNNSTKTQHIIYRFPEPLYTQAYLGKSLDFKPQVEKIIFTYPDGAHNAETLMVDPTTLDIYVVTKYGLNSILFVARYPQPVDEPFELTKVGTFPFREATAGDISQDGNQVLIKTYDQIFYWRRKGKEPLWQLLASEPTLAPYNPIELKGEAIAWSAKGYFTASEKSGYTSSPLYFYSSK